MDKQKVKEIMADVLTEWEKRHSKENLNPKTIKAVEETLLMSPHDDGLMPVQAIGSDKVHYIPIKEIILNGLKGEDITKYPTTR